jgi:tetratricopeptide (TPR) repeat protein
MALFIALILFNFGRSYIIWHRQIAFNLKEAGRDLGEMVGDNAVIGGPMAPALLYENNLEGMIYAVGISDNDPGYFRKYPITHFAIEASASGLIIEKFPELEQALNTADFWIRDSKILLVRINHLTGNPRAAEYRPTDLEIGRGWMDRGVYDSALIYVNRFADEFPENKTAIKLLCELLPANGYIDEGLAVLERGIGLYPDDYMLYILKGTLYHKMYISTNDQRLLEQAYVAYGDAVRKNRFCRRQIEEIMEKFAKN